MASVDRSDISNAIWLCGNCHKLVDNDPVRFPPGLLFEWQRAHEEFILQKIGKTSSELRRRYNQRHLDEFGKLSYLSERIIIEKSPYWEFRLTAEILRFETTPVFRRWEALKKGLYIQVSETIDGAAFLDWIHARNHEALGICEAFEGLINNEFIAAWGAPGQPGSEEAIIHTCRLYREMCESMVRWEESVRFSNPHVTFRPVRDLLVGTLGEMLDEAARFPQEIGQTFAGDSEPTEFNVSLTLKLPDGWADRLDKALDQATKDFIAQKFN